MRGTFQFRDGALFPMDEPTRDILAKLRRGQALIIDIVKDRNPQYHARAFKLLRILYDMVETDLEFNPWRKSLLVHAGYYTTIGKVNLQGVTSVAIQPDSLKFSKMKQDEFEECWAGLLRAFNTQYGKDLTRDQLTEWSVM